MRQARYPGVRLQVLSAVESLADREHQERVWVRRELPHPDEVVPLRRLGEVFGLLVDELGDEPDEVYLADPRWEEVVNRSAEALAVMRANESTLPMDLSDS
ncbi:hypothetical protein [Streptoalloteichus hindustanus]|uniref:hypothetical protein n=1 Tax=Streptoalloteichus hindustanus TaxID=2017 RepID=UPI001161067B|nr:hypothetical protein [Streptoalloteichus hindustanus]